VVDREALEYMVIRDSEIIIIWGRGEDNSYYWRRLVV
jgi:hypothetical protein